MERREQKLDLIAFGGSIYGSIAFQMVVPYIGWTMYVIPIYVFLASRPQHYFRRASITAFGAALANFYWIFNGAERFTGKGAIFSLLIFSLLFISLAIYFLLIALAVFLRWPDRKEGEVIFNAVGLACVWVIFDGFMIYTAKGFALLLFVSFIPVSNELFTIQPVTIFGPLVVTFIVIFINYLFAHFLWRREYRKLWIPAMVFLGYQSGGICLYKFYTIPGRETFNVAILAENVKPEFKWDRNNTNNLAARLFDLNRRVTRSAAKLAVWSETAVPWNYTPDDEFLKEVNRIIGSSGITSLIGMNTDYSGKTFYNSYYCIAPDNSLIGRYDKRLALSLVEKPFAGLILPFFSQESFRVKEGLDDKPLRTPYGHAGILLCNESVVPSPAYASVRAGALFFVNAGNDGWFSDTYISKQHFYHARLRAVETRRDIVVNNNSGYQGVINSNGDIGLMSRSSDPAVNVVRVSINKEITPAVRYPYLFFIGCVVLTSILLICRFFVAS